MSNHPRGVTLRFINKQRNKTPLETITNCLHHISGKVPRFSEETKLRDMGIDSLEIKELEYLLENIHNKPVDLAAGNSSGVNCVNIELTFGEILKQISPNSMQPATA